MAGILRNLAPRLSRLADDVYIWGAMRFTNMDKIPEMVQAAFSEESATD